MELGFDFGLLNKGIGATSVSATFPLTNRVALWMTRNYVSASRTIPNSWAATNDDGNLIKDCAHLAASHSPGLNSWTTNNATLTEDQIGPDGKTSAIRILATAASGQMFSSGLSIPTGTWTLVVPLKSNTASSQTVKLGNSNTGLEDKTVTTSWVEYTSVFTLGSPAGGLTLAKDDGSNTLDVLMGTPRIYAGDVHLAVPSATALAGHLKLGWNSTPTINGTSYLSFDDADIQHCLFSFDDGVDFSTGAMTHFHIVRMANELSGVRPLFKVRTSGGSSNRMLFGFRGTGILAQGDNLDITPQWSGLPISGDGWQVLGVVVDPVANERRFYIGRQLVGIVPGVGSNNTDTDRDFSIGGAQGGWFTGDWIGGGIYNRALSTTEWATLVAACEAEIALHSQTVGTVRNVVIIEGDSITSDNSGAYEYYPYFASTTPLNPRRLLINLAVPGNGYTQVNGRRATRLRYMSDTANRTYTLSIWWTNGLEDSGSTYLTQIAQVIADWKTDGGNKVVFCVPTPKSALVQPTYNTERAIVIAGKGGVANVDVFSDFSADSRYGDDADALDTAKYPDGAHPTTTVQSQMAETWKTALDSLG